MYQGKRISVAMATYNGEKYIQEQLESIITQTVIPDEIVISDDGSRDKTVEIAREIAASHSVSFLILTDNPRHGFAFNFGHAVSHCTGDILFLCDQDDIWDSQKIEHVVNAFCKHQDALCVFHNAVSIDSNGKLNHVLFNPYIQTLADKHPLGSIVKVPGETNCEIAASAPLINGMVMSVSRKLLDVAFPFPPISSQHDGWLWFCAEALDGCYYLNEVLTKRRLHTQNTSGVGTQGLGLQRLRKVIHRIAQQNDTARTRTLYGKYMQGFIERYCQENNPGAMRALPTIQRVTEIGQVELSAAQSSRFFGAAKLIKLYLTDMRYRRSGIKAFLYELADILLRSKKQRLHSLEGIMK